MRLAGLFSGLSCRLAGWPGGPRKNRSLLHRGMRGTVVKHRFLSRNQGFTTVRRALRRESDVFLRGPRGRQAKWHERHNRKAPLYTLPPEPPLSGPGCAAPSRNADLDPEFSVLPRCGAYWGPKVTCFHGRPPSLATPLGAPEARFGCYLLYFGAGRRKTDMFLPCNSATAPPGPPGWVPDRANTSLSHREGRRTVVKLRF